MSDEVVCHAYRARAAEYTNLLGSIEDMHELDRQRIAQWAADVPGAVLDVGCGPGHWTHFLHQQGIDVSGIDLLPEFINTARSRFPEVPFWVGSLRSLDIAHGSLGGVLAWYSLIHLDPAELPEVMAELHRVIAPGGHLLVGFFEGESGLPFDHAVIRAYFWSIEQMSQLLQDAGFAVLEVETRHDHGNRPHAAIAAIAGTR